MWKLALSEEHAEVCALITGRFSDDGHSANAHELIHVRNVADKPESLFVMSPEEQLRAFEYAHEVGLHIVGCFHTHPRNKGIPSTTDLAMANEDYFWVIWGGYDFRMRTWYYNSNDPTKFQDAVHQQHWVDTLDEIITCNQSVSLE
jgi:proteasome lid subunit RPN8/RPN11